MAFSKSYGVWVLLLAVLLLACRSDTQWKEIAGEPPVGKVVLFGNRVIVSPAARVSWKELVKLEVFDGFTPGITIEEAKRKFGEPTATATNHYGPYSVYRRPGANLHVAWEEHRSGKDAYKVWTLRAYLDAATSADILHPSVAKYIEPGVEKAEVIVLDSSGEPAVDIRIRNGKPDTITWIKL